MKFQISDKSFAFFHILMKHTIFFYKRNNIPESM